MHRKSGFTLIEVLLVGALLGMLGIAALTTYLDSSSTFEYFGSYKTVMSSIRATRSYAVNNLDGGDQPVYFVRLDTKCVTVGRGAPNYAAMEGAADCPARNKLSNVIVPASVNLEGTAYNIVGYKLPEGKTLPLYLSYETLTGELTANNYLGNEVQEIPNIPVGNQIIFWLSFTEDGDPDHEQFIAINYTSGLAEEFNQGPEL